VSITKALNGILHRLPQTGEYDWGEDLTAFFLQLVDHLEGALKIFALIVGRISSPFQPVIASTGATPLDFSLGYNLRVALQASTTFSFSNPRDGERYFLKLYQDAVGGRIVTWPGNIDWVPAAPTLTVTPNKFDIVAFMYDATVARYSGEFRLGYG